MQEINNYIKENDTDNVELINLKKLTATLKSFAYGYKEGTYTENDIKAKTTSEILLDIKSTLSDYLNDMKHEKIFCKLWRNNNCNTFIGIKSDFNKFDIPSLDGDMIISNKSITDNKISLGEIELYDTYHKSMKLYGNIPCTYGLNDGDADYCGVISFYANTYGRGKAYLVLSDTSIFDSEDKSVWICSSGTCYWKYADYH